MIGFAIWSLVFLIFVGIGISCWKSEETVGFFNVCEPPKIADENVKSYNHAVAILWFVFSFVLELLGLPLLFFKQNSPYFALMLIPVMFLVIGTVIVYLRIEAKYRRK